MRQDPAFVFRTLEELTIEDEAAFHPVGLYRELHDVLVRAKYQFRVLKDGESLWDRALFLNLTFWEPQRGGDVLAAPVIPADVVAHVAWHHLAVRALQGEAPRPMTSDELFLGESIASAFDLYCVGRLIGQKRGSSFLDTQVEAMADAADAAGLDEEAFAALLEAVSEAPEAAFESLRQLLFDASTALVRCSTMSEAAVTLSSFHVHRFFPLLHHYQLSNWVLFARAYAEAGFAPDPRAREIDRSLRNATDSLAWLTTSWIDRKAV